MAERVSERIPDRTDTEPGLPTEGIARIQFNELTFEKLIGEGNYGDVHKGQYFDVEVAIKQIILDDPEYFKYIKREIRILSQMRHPFILQFLGVCEHGPDIFIVTEYLSSGDVTQLLESDGDVPWKLRMSISTQLCQAMIYLHSKSIIHRDLKPDNILIDEHDNIRLADFGLARVLDTSTRERALTICGTDGFIAPEVMLGMNYSPKCDIFSYGMVLAQIITRLEPGEDFWCRGETGDLGLDDDEFINLVPQTCPAELRDLTLGCGAFDADDRPSFNDILSVLKYVTTKLFGGSVRRAARRSQRGGGGEADEKTATLLGTLSRKTLRDTGAGTLPLNSSQNAVQADDNDTEANTTTAAAAAVQSTPPAAAQDDKSTQMLLFHVMKLVQRSTHEDYSDAPYAEDFLLTYVEFLPSAKLLNLLCQRWQHVPTPSEDATPLECAELAKRAKLVRLRSLAFVKLWVSRHLDDFDLPGMQEGLAAFDKLTKADGFGNNAMSALVERRRQAKAQPPKAPTFASPPPASHLPGHPLSLETIHPIEVARQLTLVQARLFSAIDTRSLLREAWKQQPKSATSIYVQHMLQFKKWIVSSILKAQSATDMLAKIISVAHGCNVLKNFNGLFTVLSALSSPPIKRLLKSFSKLPNKAKTALSNLQALEANDYEKHRAQQITPPAIPHFSAALDELSYVESSSAARLPSGIINFRRYRHIGLVCRNLRQFQQSPFNIAPLPAVQDWIVKDFETVLDDESAKRLSLQV